MNRTGILLTSHPGKVKGTSIITRMYEYMSIDKNRTNKLLMDITFI